MLQITKSLIFIIIAADFVYVYISAREESTLQPAITNSSSRDCPRGFFGPKCRDKCKATCSICDSNRDCLECSSLGVRLPECAKACKRGFYGSNCKHRCASECLNTECDPRTGYCLACRDIGYSLPTCTFPCLSGTFGMHCQDRCPATCKDDCDRLSGICKSCEVGEGPHCTVNCALSEHRDKCSLHCPKKCVGWCNTAHKRCSMCSPGFKVPHCREYCDSGTYGSQCNQNCSVRCSNNNCDPITGECVSCIDGYVGRWCNGKCVQGLYGPGCAMPCSETCLGKQCHAETGYCVKCLTGYTGILCDRLCDTGTHGAECHMTCPPKCRWPCDPVTGECQECQVGYRGSMCNSTCEKGSYGFNCNRTCPVGCLGDICQHKTGDCAECKEYFHGPKCTRFAARKTRPFEIVVYSVLSLLTPVVLLGVVMACYKHCSLKENNSVMEKVKETEGQHTPKPRQKKEQRARINKSEIQMIGETATAVSQNIDRAFRGYNEVHKTQLLTSYDALTMNILKPPPPDWQPSTGKHDKGMTVATTISKEPKENGIFEDRAIETEPAQIKPPELACAAVSPRREVAQQRQMYIIERQANVKPASSNHSKKETLNTTPSYDQDYAHRKDSSSHIKSQKGVKGFDIFGPFARTGASTVSQKPTLRSSEDELETETKLQACAPVHKTKQAEKMAAYVSAGRDAGVEESERIAPLEDVQNWQQATPSQRLAKEKETIITNSSIDSSSPESSSVTKQSLKNAGQAISFSSHGRKPKLSGVVSSPSHIDVIAEAWQISSPPPQPKRTKTPSPHNRSQLQRELSLSQVPNQQHTMLSPSHNMPQLQRAMSASTHHRPEKTSSPHNAPQSLRTMSLLSQNVPQSQRTMSLLPQNAPQLQRTMSPVLPQNVPQSQRTAMSPLPQNMPQSQRTMSPILSQNVPQSQRTMSLILSQNAPQSERTSGLHVPQSERTPGLYVQRSDVAMSPSLKYMSQSQHTTSSALRSFLPTQDPTSSQHGKPKLLSIEHAPSRPQSSSSLRPNNTLSSLLTMPNTSDSWPGQPRSRSNLYAQGNSSTLTNITCSYNETSVSGHNKQLSSTTNLLLPEAQDSGSTEMDPHSAKQLTGVPPDISSGRSTDAIKPTSFTFSRRKGKIDDSEEEPITPVRQESEDITRSPEIEEPPDQNTREIPSSSSGITKPGSLSRRTARSAKTEPGESAQPKRPQSKSPGLVRCATTRKQVQSVSPESRARQRFDPLPAPPAQGRAILKPVHKQRVSRQHPKSNSRSSISDDANKQPQSD